MSIVEDGISYRLGMRKDDNKATILRLMPDKIFIDTGKSDGMAIKWTRDKSPTEAAGLLLVWLIEQGHMEVER
jgi:hypothetical protein